MAHLSAAQRARIRRLSRPRELSPEDEGGELNIIPFLDIVVNILIFVLATVAVTFTTSLETTPPGAGGKGVRQDSPQRTLGLTILIVNQGFSLKAEGSNVAPGCSAKGIGLAIPKRGDEYDFAGLQSCAQKVKTWAPDYADETQAYLSANPDVPYATLVATMDALRNTNAGSALFPDINFKVSQ